MNRTIERTLAWCNRVRVAAGKKPLKEMPKGVKGESTRCPIANALNFDASVCDTVATEHPKLQEALLETGSEEDADSASFSMPYDAKRFVGAFDNGRYPELVRKS